MKKILQTTIEQVHWDNTQDYQDGNGYSRGEGGGCSLIWPIRGRAAGQGMVFWPLCPKQGM